VVSCGGCGDFCRELSLQHLTFLLGALQKKPPQPTTPTTECAIWKGRTKNDCSGEVVSTGQPKVARTPIGKHLLSAHSLIEIGRSSCRPSSFRIRGATEA
jgi:hypothetical protein